MNDQAEFVDKNGRVKAAFKRQLCVLCWRSVPQHTTGDLSSVPFIEENHQEIQDDPGDEIIRLEQQHGRVDVSFNLAVHVRSTSLWERMGCILEFAL